MPWEHFTGPTGAGTGHRLNVKNLTKETDTKEKLNKLFARFGTIIEADIKTKDGGSGERFWFRHFEG